MLRSIKMSVDIDESLTLNLLDNGDVIVDSCKGEPPTSVAVVQIEIEESVQRLQKQIERLNTIYDVLDGSAGVALTRVVRAKRAGPAQRGGTPGTCVDCDIPSSLSENLVLSEWGDEDYVCPRCEALRAHEYGLPPVEPD